MRKFKCISVDTIDKRIFTVNKVYKTDDKMLNWTGDNKILFKFTKIVEPKDAKRCLVFEELIEEEGEIKMEDLRELLKQGYVVEHIDGKLSRVELNEHEELIISGENHYYPIKGNLDENLEYDDGVGDWAVLGIKTIYGYSKYNKDTYEVSTNGRKIIWKREEKSPAQLEIESIESEQRKLADRLSELRKGM